jgi:hypothetical protein
LLKSFERWIPNGFWISEREFLEVAISNTERGDY